ncbi:hypothetical protein PDESU_03966 [Pontiella desulfatans]|uniref:SGNH hydrolase-type esterase domain-containing protein n=1 Tax=Pontiella desulfatans TaxID=2750659 RepID=A0A6C2U654_PONDE|nr:GDSL-type esterase/lipase family protein [Pontiella desulfatans]VGO15383.1 hypothetical protein PDESU_03966 [Pontiella desulfatans]
MKKTIFLTALAMAAGLAQAGIVALDTNAASIVSNGGTQGADITLTDGTHAFNVGETVKMTWDLGITGTPAYSASANWSVGFLDGAGHGAALSIRLNGAALWNASTDDNAPTADNNTALLGTADRESATNADGTAYDLKDDGESAQFELQVTKVSSNEYNYVARWKDTGGTVLDSISKTYDLGVELSNIASVSFGNRATSGSVTGNLSNLTLEVLTPPSSATTNLYTEAAYLRSMSPWQDGSTSIGLKDATETGTGLRQGLLRFDLSGVGTNDVTNASFTLTAKKEDTYTLYAWGVVDNAPGQNWNDTTTTMSNVLTSGMYTPIENLESADDTNLVLLGSQSVAGAGAGAGYDTYTLASQSLVDWLNTDTDGDATIVVSIGENVNTAMRSGTAGSEPFLTYTLTGATPPSTNDAVVIDANDTNIIFRGSQYITSTASATSFKRHSDATLNDLDNAFTPAKALTGTGISIEFKTDSDAILARFSQDLSAEYKGGRFSYYEDGVLMGSTDFFGGEDMSFTINSASPGTASVYRITMPTWANPVFQGLELELGSSLQPLAPAAQKTYVSIGDSITHGRGQAVSSETYPWRVAEALDLDLYNVAVGGAKISVPTAEMLADFPPVDVVTVLIGYNDLHAGKSIVEYAADFSAMLDALRVSQPDARIVCISPTYTDNPSNTTTGVTIQDFRQVVYDEVAARRAANDYKIHLVRGEEISSAANLRDGDPVHFSVEGAAAFATELAPLMEPFAEGSVDFDGDSLTDAQEEALGTDPTDAASFFAVSGQTPLPMPGKFEIRWPSASNVLYKVWESPDLTHWAVARDWAVAQTPPEDALEIDLSPSNGFFKVEAEIQ